MKPITTAERTRQYRLRKALGLKAPPTGRKSRPADERFFENVEEPFDSINDCWQWKGNCTSQGYGRFWNGAHEVSAHCWSYEFFFGPIQEGLEVHHDCENPRCVSPTHLEAMTPAEHQRRSPDMITTINREKTHCPQGHPYDGDNLYVAPGESRRHCRQCSSEASRRYKARKRLAKSREKT